MSPPEIAILGFGIGLGFAVGGAIMATLRWRLGARADVRITVAPNSIAPRRASTLAYTEPAQDDGTGPAMFGDEPWPYAVTETAEGAVTAAATVLQPAAEPPLTRTRVPSGPVHLPVTAIAVPVGAGPLGGATVRDLVPVVTILDVTAGEAVARPLAVEALAAGQGAGPSGGSIAITARTESAASPSTAGDRAPAARRANRRSAAADPCRSEHVAVDERCAAAGLARERARDAADRLRDLRNAYELLREQAERAHEAADPDAVTVAKDTLHRTFRAARDAATTAGDMEAAARGWLDGVNNVNAAAREARSVADATEREVREMLPRLERLIAEAETARNAAELADAGCRAAREILATCEEHDTGASVHALAARMPAAHPRAASPAGAADNWDPAADNAAPASDDSDMTIVRILRGDAAAGDALAARLAAGEPGAEPAWRARIDALVAAVASRAIDEGYLDLPDDGFWRPFNRTERREVVVALAALGYRYDGVAGFADGRTPLQRDLVLAVGYAGLDRMRIRAWPDDAGLGAMFAEAAVAADEWLADRATDLSLGRMVDALGARADDLADIWNAWGRVRPALIASR